MKRLKHISSLLIFLGLFWFNALLFTGPFVVDAEILDKHLSEQQKENLGDILAEDVVGMEFTTSVQLGNAITDIYKKRNEALKKAELWDKVMYQDPQSFAFPIVKDASQSHAKSYPAMAFLLSIGLMIIGGLGYIVPNIKLLGYKGIKNNHIYHQGLTSGKVSGIILGSYLILFYILLYWFPAYIVNWVLLVDPFSLAISGNPASQWFLYGFMYCLVMAVMGVRMAIKYRHNKYQLIRTGSVVFFQISFAFLIPEILVRFNKPYMDFKNIWPLDYDFFFGWNLDQLVAEGTLGLFMLIWGIALVVVAVPVFTYFYGKRWYCSWVCGCGGLAETAGDPFRQLSDKSLKAWKIERYSIHGVLVFAIIMTGLTLYTYFSGSSTVLGLNTYDVQKSYGFLIGSAFAGVVGTGFYPMMGNRVWCRFGCPLAAYLGLVQRFKSRFRITTNGGQCISCGNCSTYCEMGIDVRWYAQRGQNIVRSSCVGCGVCSAVCPRGVLKLENGPEKGRVNNNPIIIGNDKTVTLDLKENL
ncbi:4Fe-4S binding protein [Luteibaculum oceani]|uniref:4Fe-4S binding protein n=1 Tax=Luteibaculum oceani TaxID=1294296 RepID=A0A5C6UUJ8_9FLAO|nr:4Fe-4S dicluster domain-containing protein [Luteibaculum oceani]TXC76997.1 4Fe-4S binding protein [Luteibaculum oceani]